MLILPPVHPTITIRAEWGERIPLRPPNQSWTETPNPPPSTDHYTTSIPPSAPIAVGRPITITSANTIPPDTPVCPTKTNPVQKKHKPFKGVIVWIRRINETQVVVGAKNRQREAEVFMAYVTILYPQRMNMEERRNTYPCPCPLPLITTNPAPDQTPRSSLEKWDSHGPSLRVRKILASPTVGGKFRKWRINLGAPRRVTKAGRGPAREEEPQ